MTAEEARALVQEAIITLPETDQQLYDELMVDIKIHIKNTRQKRIEVPADNITERIKERMDLEGYKFTNLRYGVVIISWGA